MAFRIFQGAKAHKPNRSTIKPHKLPLKCFPNSFAFRSFPQSLASGNIRYRNKKKSNDYANKDQIAHFDYLLIKVVAKLEKKKMVSFCGIRVAN